MALKITYHSAENADQPKANFGSSTNVMPPQVGNRVDLAVSGTAAPAAAVSQNLFACLLPDGEDCVIAWGLNAVATAANGYPLKNGVDRWLYLKTGERISVIAAA